MPSRYTRKTPPKNWPEMDRALGPAWEPLVPEAPRVLAEAVVHYAICVDLLDPKRTLPVFRWIAESGVLPDSGPLARRKLLPVAIATAERILHGEVTGQARRYKHRLAPHHRATLARLLREHRERVTV